MGKRKDRKKQDAAEEKLNTKPADTEENEEGNQVVNIILGVICISLLIFIVVLFMMRH